MDYVEEFDKLKTKALKYILFKKRTEQEVRQKFREDSGEMLDDVIEELTEKDFKIGIKVRRNIDNVFINNSTADQKTLRRWFLNGNYVEYKCSVCNLKQWNGKPISLILDHINGNNKDSRLENLRWV